METIPEAVKQFIFEYIDSVEQMEVLLLLRRNSSRTFTAKGVSDEMRRSPDSCELRLRSLEDAGFLTVDGNQEYHYVPASPEVDAVIGSLEDAYRIRPHKVLELIFSPMKKARGFADAFMMKRKKSEDPDG